MSGRETFEGFRRTMREEKEGSTERKSAGCFFQTGHYAIINIDWKRVFRMSEGENQKLTITG
jgi:hypothetical protein